MNAILRLSIISVWLAVFVFVCLFGIADINAVEFGDEIRVSDEMEGIEFSRNPQNMIQVTTDGIVNMVYTLPDLSLPIPNTNIYYQTIENGIPNPTERINSQSANALHPSMRIGIDGSVHVAWQDSRHSTAAGNWIDNLEIYYDVKQLHSSFLDTDIRITQTTAAHLGDNGYAPQLALHPDGRVWITWYDFHFDGSHADVYLRLSELDGAFQPMENIQNFRITQEDNTGASNWLPTITPFGNQMYMIWGVQEGFTAILNVHGINFDANGMPLENEPLWMGSKFLDPGRLASGINGSIGCVYTNIVNNSNVILFRHRKTSGFWSEPILINQSAFHATQPHFAYDSKGTAHIVWQEDVGGIFEIHYAAIDPETMQILTEQTVSSLDADARTPVIAIQPITDRITIAWVDKRNTPLNQVIMIQEIKSDIHNWQTY